jgi:catechol 2,3-dioxygenase-like lactoylglutathione lyase family enzyme
MNKVFIHLAALVSAIVAFQLIYTKVLGMRVQQFNENVPPTGTTLKQLRNEIDAQNDLDGFWEDTDGDGIFDTFNFLKDLGFE